MICPTMSRSEQLHIMIMVQNYGANILTAELNADNNLLGLHSAFLGLHSSPVGPSLLQFERWLGGPMRHRSHPGYYLVCVLLCLSATVFAQSPRPASFLSAVDYAAGSRPYSVGVGDFNGDGKL